MKKHSFEWHGRRYYLLGADKEEQKYYLRTASFDCGWYWGIGYVQTFTNKRNPRLSKDISSYDHFDAMFFGIENRNGFDAFREAFPFNPFSDDEIWEICELMKSAYTARHYADMLYCGGSNYTENPAKDIIKNSEEYDRINKVVIPEIMEKLYAILKGE